MSCYGPFFAGDILIGAVIDFINLFTAVDFHVFCATENSRHHWPPLSLHVDHVTRSRANGSVTRFRKQKHSVECDNGIPSKQEDKITQNIVWSVTMAFIVNKKTK